MTGTVIGEMLGLPGNNRRITFRILHVFEFRDGLISRENVWLDTAAIVGQLALEPKWLTGELGIGPSGRRTIHS